MYIINHRSTENSASTSSKKTAGCGVTTVLVIRYEPDFHWEPVALLSRRGRAMFRVCQ